MSRYPAIWKTDLDVSSAPLLDEFRRAIGEELKVVYPDNPDWTGVTVMAPGKPDLTDKLPALCAFLERVGQDGVIGVTYFNMKAQSKLHRHRDMNGNLLFGVIRLHVPLQTNPRALFEMERQLYQMPLDSVWAIDTSGLHAVENLGDENRIHLVVDIKRSANTARFFPVNDMALKVHMSRFAAISAWKLLRDTLSRPSSLVTRFNQLKSRVAH